MELLTLRGSQLLPASNKGISSGGGGVGSHGSTPSSSSGCQILCLYLIILWCTVLSMLYVCTILFYRTVCTKSHFLYTTGQLKQHFFQTPGCVFDQQVMKFTQCVSMNIFSLMEKNRIENMRVQPNLLQVVKIRVVLGNNFSYWFLCICGF